MKTLLILSSVSSLPKGTGYTQDIKELAEELTQQSKAEFKKELESLPTFKFRLHNSQTSSFF